MGKGKEINGNSRPRGMRSDPDYRSFTHYMRKDTHHHIFSALHEKNDGTTFSALVEQLLGVWLDQQKSRLSRSRLDRERKHEES